MAGKKGGLGRGLDLLFADNSSGEEQNIIVLPIGEVEPNRDQPRKEFDQESLLQLADSIREHGVLQPLLVRPMPGGGYQIIAGERRWRASRIAGLGEVPVIVKELTDGESMELALIENLQREDLNPIEEAMGYQVLMEQYGNTQEEVARRVGKSRPAVANALRLLQLPQPVLQYVRGGELTAGHARALLSLRDEKQALELAREMIRTGISVRQAEKIVKKWQSQENPEKRPGGSQDIEESWENGESYYREVELALAEALGRKVKVTTSKGKEADGVKGLLQIEFYSREELGQLANRLAGEER